MPGNLTLQEFPCGWSDETVAVVKKVGRNAVPVLGLFMRTVTVRTEKKTRI